ncbi:hypothetical protein FSP39_021327 [Pinctada imbricata]|uniref:EF-hand domain-containing protein n=1 Tax=Pinctada imbricata TaxID=66713 RepID=A0AA88Y135_PINIB|nr:hypothetical protein FSP39_021327 [Pinctada imbricata]
MRAVGLNPTKNDVDRIVKQLDENENGFIDFDEFKQLLVRSWRSVKENQLELVAAFRIFDINKDGYVSLEELVKVLTSFGEKMTEDEAREYINMVDSNGDGKLNYQGGGGVCIIQSVLFRMWRAYACYLLRSAIDIQRGQLVGTLSSLKRFGQGLSWCPVVIVSQSGSLKNALVQDRKFVKYQAYCPSGDIRIIFTVLKCLMIQSHFDDYAVYL